MLLRQRDQTLVDSYGRVATDLRISVTDRCDLRCVYCMPEEGLEWIDSSQILSFDEIVRLAELFTTMGIRSIRLTGGEPLMRPHLDVLVSRLAALDIEDLSMTTNGTSLERHASQLATAGLNRVNVSLDSLVAEKVESIARRNVLDRVLAGIHEARRVGLAPLKINCVLIRGHNDDEIFDFVEFARSTGCEVRFIEDMPLGGGDTWTDDIVVSGHKIIDAIGRRYRLVGHDRGSAPSATYGFADGSPGGVGVINSVTEPFCSKCDRLRLTADGYLRTCLFSHTETDLRTPLRAGVSSEELGEIVRTAVYAKGPGHAIGTALFEQPVRLMSRIGG